MKKIIACTLFFAVAAVFAAPATIVPSHLQKRLKCFSYVDDNRKTAYQDCYDIYDAEDLYGFAAMVNGDDGFEKDSLAIGYIHNDIVVNEKVLNEDGSLVEDAEDLVPWIPLKNFSGSLTTSSSDPIIISGLYFKDSNADNVGLVGNFISGSVYMDGVVGPLTIKNSYFEGRSNVGAFCGNDENGGFAKSQSVNYATVKGVSNVGGIVGKAGHFGTAGVNYGDVFCTDGHCGGIVGSTVQVEYGKNHGNVKCLKGYCGGLAGYTDSLKAFNRFENAGNITCDEGICGGIAGYVGDYVYVDQMLNEGTISGDVAGGLFGYVHYSIMELSNAYNVGEVVGKNYAAGLIGQATTDETVKNDQFCYIDAVYNIGKISGDGQVDALVNDVDGILSFRHSYYLEGTESSVGISVAADSFENGYVAAHLKRSYGLFSKVWGQHVGIDKYPVFTTDGVVNAKFKLSFELNGGTLKGNCPDYYLSGKKTWLPVGDDSEPVDDIASEEESPFSECTISKEGYRFVGWYPSDEEWTGSSYDIKNIVTYIDSSAILDYTYQAIWTNDTYSVIYKIALSGEDEDYEEYFIDDGVMFTTHYKVLDDPPEKEGYTFGGWSISGASWDGDGTFIMPNDDVFIYGKYNKKKYTVEFVDTASTSKRIYYGEIDNVPYGDTIAPLDTIPERDYYTFVGWTKDGENKYNFSTPVKGNTYLYALWTLTEDSVLVDVDGKTMWVKFFLTDNVNTINSKIQEAIKANPEMAPLEKYSDGKYECTFTGDWEFVGGNVYKPVYSKTPIILEETVLMNGVKQKVFIKATYSEADVQSLISAAAFSNLDMRFKKTYYDDEYEYTFVKWVKNDSGYYVPSYSKTAREVQKGGEQDSSKQDVAKQDSTKNSESKQDSTKKDTDKDSKKDTKKDSKKDAIPALPVEFASLEVHGMGLAITGLANYSTVTVHDMLGHAVAFAHAVNGACSIQLPYAGSYIVRIGKRGYKVSVK